MSSKSKYIFPVGTQIAVLDDYHNFTKTYLPQLRPPASSTSSIPYEFVLFPETILPTSSSQVKALLSRLKPFPILITMRERTPLRRVVLEKLPNLKLIFTTGMRNLGIDMDACKELGIRVFGTPGGLVNPAPGAKGSTLVGSPPDFNATVQQTWALIFSIVNNLPRDHNLVTSGSWLGASPLNTFIGGQTIGLLGLGKLGTGVARIARVAFGMRVIAWSENLTQAKADKLAAERGLEPGSFEVVSKDRLFRESDIVSIHLVLSDRSRDLVRKADLDKMKSTSFLVNTARGPIVNESDLLEVLEAGRIRGAALDVFDLEPLPLDSKWRTTKWGQDGKSEVAFTPHSGYAYTNHMEWMWEKTIENVQRLIDGEELQWEL